MPLQERVPVLHTTQHNSHGSCRSHAFLLAAVYVLLSLLLQPVSCFTLPTSNSVLLSALEWGEVMVVKDTVTYFGRNAAGGSSAVRDLFLPDRPMVSTV